MTRQAHRRSNESEKAKVEDRSNHALLDHVRCPSKLSRISARLQCTECY